jgi:hypothetical protein
MCHIKHLTAEQREVFRSLPREQRNYFEYLTDRDDLPSRAATVRPAFERFLKTLPETTEQKES